MNIEILRKITVFCHSRKTIFNMYMVLYIYLFIIGIQISLGDRDYLHQFINRGKEVLWSQVAELKFEPVAKSKGYFF